MHFAYEKKCKLRHAIHFARSRAELGEDVGKILFETICSTCGLDSDEEAVEEGENPTVEASTNTFLQMTEQRYGHARPGRSSEQFSMAQSKHDAECEWSQPSKN
jgi:hypothetical protein